MKTVIEKQFLLMTLKKIYIKTASTYTGSPTVTIHYNKITTTSFKIETNIDQFPIIGK